MSGSKQLCAASSPVCIPQPLAQPGLGRGCSSHWQQRVKQLWFGAEGAALHCGPVLEHPPWSHHGCFLLGRRADDFEVAVVRAGNGPSASRAADPREGGSSPFPRVTGAALAGFGLLYSRAMSREAEATGFHWLWDSDAGESIPNTASLHQAICK